MKPVSRIVWLGALAGLLLCTGTTPAKAADGAFVGSETCKGCHEEMVTGFDKSFHAQAWAATGKNQGNGCEACHGPGGKHAEEPSKESIITFGKKSVQAAEVQSAQCLKCHSKDADLALWKSGAHVANEVGCGSCHSIHGDVKPKVSQPDTCFDCHKDVRAQANKPSHHPLKEGKVACSDCHNPHGSLAHGMLRAETTNLLCYNCHAEKRGPFVWEHPPVEENCAACHAPHGSRHDKLLTEKAPLLCQNCHDWSRHPGTPYDDRNSFSGASPSSRFFARGCLNCHNNIHGSNAPGNEGKYFVE